MGEKDQQSVPAEVRLTDETIESLNQRMAQSVAEGIKAALNKDTAKMFWEAGAEMLQEQAAQRTGRFVLGGISKIARQLAGIAVIAIAFYMVGGWAAVVTFFKAAKAVVSSP